MTPNQQPSVVEPTASSEEIHFRTDHLKQNLAGRTARGGVVTFLSQGLKFVLSTVATVILGRLLTPEDYGLIGMVAVVVGFISLFKDLGLSAATIQKDEINYGQISTLFWVNVGLSLAVTAVVAALAPVIAWFFREPRLVGITLGFSMAFIFSGLVVQHEALLRRQMRFFGLSIAEIVSLVAGITTAVSLAWSGFGYWSLIASQLMQGAVYLIFIWSLLRWRPRLPSRNSGVRSMLVFGRNLTGFSIINYFARNLDNILIGKVWGSQSLGLYAKAYQLLLLPIDQVNGPISAVAIPALSRLNDAPERYRQAYLRLLEKVALLTMPGMAVLIATSDWVIFVALGPQWSGAAKIFALLGIAGLVQPIANTTGWLFISQGRTNDMFRWGMIGSTLLIVGIVVGLPWGAIGVATSYSAMFTFIVSPLLFWFVGRKGPVRTIDFYRTIAPIGCASLMVLLSLTILRQLIHLPSMVLSLICALAIAAIVTLLVLVSLPAGRETLRDLKQSLLLITDRGKA